MKTTAIFVELLIVGIGAVAWILLFAIAVVGAEPIHTLFSGAAPNAAIMTILLIAIAYVLGIVADRIYLPVWSRLERYLREREGIGLADYYKWEVAVATKAPIRLLDHLGYYTSRMRILRGSMVNFFLCGITGAWALGFCSTKAILVFMVAFFVSIATGVAYWHLATKYYGYVKTVQARDSREV